MKKSPFIFLAALALFTSCYTVKPVSSVMDKWLGASEHDVILHMGSPYSSVSDGAGGKILRYEKSSTVTNYSQTAYYGSNYGVANTYDRSLYKEFYINSSGKVYSWRTNHRGPKELHVPSTIIATVVIVTMFIFFGSVLTKE